MLTPILINFPDTLRDQLDQAASELNLSRSALIRKMLTRDLEFVKQFEIPCATALKHGIEGHYKNHLLREKDKSF